MNDLYGDSAEQDTTQGTDDAASQVSDAAASSAITAPVPSLQGKKVIGHSPDGSYQFDGGISYNPSTDTMQWDDHGTRFINAGGMSKTLARPIPRPIIQKDDMNRPYTVDPVTQTTKYLELPKSAPGSDLTQSTGEDALSGIDP